MKALRSMGLCTLVVSCALGGTQCGAAAEGDPLWGFADLHAHPAFHLAYGANLNGNDLAQAGIMWGLPGDKLEDDTVATDLMPCDADSHGRANIIANVLLTQLAEVLGTPHGKNGYPTFDNWPLATAGLHQQMHVTWLHRAWQGGQRLMVASVVENATLAAGFKGNVHPPGAPAIHDAERAVAEAQIAFIKKLVTDNPTWLALATSSDEAITAIRGNKMAIVLGTEFDTLDKQEMTELYGEGVRVFIPIHLADNDLGGTAVYEDAFNVHNTYMRGVGYAIMHDDFLKFALKLDIPPLKLLGLPFPDPTDNTNAGVLPLPGHRNVKGLADAGHEMIQAMIDLGAIIDVAHMGQQSIDDALHDAENAQVPVMDSHTGVRPPSELAYSERDLRFQDAVRIGKLGGMIGLGTGGITADMTTTTQRTFYASPFGKVTVASPSFTGQIPQQPAPVVCKGLSLTVTTADDDIRDGSYAKVEVTNYQDPTNPVPPQTFDLNRGFHVDNHQSITRMIPLADGLLSSQIDVMLRHETQDNFFQSDDKWNVGSITLACGPRAFESDVTKTLKGDDTVAMTVSTTDTTMVTAVPIDVWTGDQNLDSSNQLDVEVHTKLGGMTTCQDVLHKSGLDSKTLKRLACSLPSAVAMSDIDSVTLHKHGSSGSWEVVAWTVGLDDGSAPPATFVDTTYAPPLEVKAGSLLLASRTLAERMVRLTITSDTQGLEKGIDATATFHFSDGSPDQTIHINHGAPLFAGQVDVAMTVTVPIPLSSTFQFYAILDGTHVSSDIQSVRIDAPGITSDWPITHVVLEAFEEPVERWVADLRAVTLALNRSDDGCFSHDGFCGVALGTDLNGLAPAIPGTTLSPYDPLQPGKYVLQYPFELGSQPVVEGLITTGSKTWDVTRDGIAHVGLLPDFLVAAAHATQTDATRTVATVFHSAGDFVRMWQKVESKKK